MVFPQCFGLRVTLQGTRMEGVLLIIDYGVQRRTVGRAGRKMAASVKSWITFLTLP